MTSKVAPVYTATETRSGTIDNTKKTPERAATERVAPKPASNTEEGKSQLARKRASTLGARTTDGEDNEVTYKPMRAYEAGGKRPKANPDDNTGSKTARSVPGTGTAPVLADNPSASRRVSPNEAGDQHYSPLIVDETAGPANTLDEEALMAQQQMLQEQWMSAMARVRFMNEMRAQQMWMQQQQAVAAQQQYNENRRRWMEGEEMAGARATHPTNEETGGAADGSCGSVRGSFLSILAPPSRHEKEDDNDDKDEDGTDSATESRTDLYGDLSEYNVEPEEESEADGSDTQQEGGSRVARGLSADGCDDLASEDGRSAAGDGSGLVKQSSLFDIVDADGPGGASKTRDRCIVASTPKPTATTARASSLGVVVEPSDRRIVKATLPHSITTTDPTTKVVFDFELDEVSTYTPKDSETVSADLLREMSRHALEGHRGVLLVSVSDGAEEGGEAVVRTSLCNLLSRTGAGIETDDTDAESGLLRVDVSAVIIRRSETMHDLLAGLTTATSTRSIGTYSFGGSILRDTTLGGGDDDADGGDESLAFTPIVTAGNPVAGHWVGNANFIRIESPQDVESGVMVHVSPWLHKSAAEAQRDGENLALFATVVQEKGTDKKLYLSSLLVLVSRSADEAYRACTRPQKQPPVMQKLLKRVGHGVFTVAACCLSSDAGGAVREYVMACRSLQAVHNSSLLSGNVQRYLTYAKGQHTKADARLTELQANNESPRTIAFAEQALKIHATAIEDMEALIADPREGPVHFINDPSSKETPQKTPAEPVASRAIKLAEPREEPTRASPATATNTAEDNLRPVSSYARAETPQKDRDAKKDEWEELGDDRATEPQHSRGGVQATAPPTIVPSSVSPASTAPKVSFADRRVHVVAMVDDPQSGYTIKKESRATPASGNTQVPRMTILRKESSDAYTVDEAVTSESVAATGGGAPFSRHVTALCETFASGYNCALVSYDGRNNNLFESPAWAAVREAVRSVLDAPADTRDLRLSVVLLNGNGEAADLLVSSSDYHPITIVASPLFGPVVDGARLVPIYSENDVRELLFIVAANIGNRWAGDTVLHVTIVSSISTHADVMVASFKASIFGSHHRFCTQTLKSTTPKPVLALHRQFTQGIAASVLLLAFLNAHDADYSRTMIEDAEKLPSKMPLRDGSVRVFVQDTRKSLEKRAQKAAQATTDDERRRNEKVNRKIESMVTDYEETLYEPATHFPKSYTNGSDSATTGIASGARALAAEDTRKPKAKEKLHPYLVIGIEKNGSVARQLRVNGRGVTWLTTGENFDSDDTVVQYTNTDSDTIASAFNSTGEVERFASCAKSGKNATILGLADAGGDVSGSVTRPIQMQPWWLAYRHALMSSTFLDTWESGSTVQLRAVVMQDKRIFHDFLGSQATDVAVPVTVGVSPIVGSVVSNAVMKEVSSAHDLAEQVTLLESRMNAYGRQRNNTVLVIQALLRRICENVSSGSSPVPPAPVTSFGTVHDVVLSSVNAMSVRVSQDLPTLREILALDPQGTVPYSLFRFPLTGTCRTVCIVDLDSCSDARATESLRLAQRVRYVNTLPVPSGSVRNYIAYESEKAEGKPSGDGAQSNRNNNKTSSELESSVSPAVMVAGMKALLDRHGQGEIPLFDAHDAQVAGADSPRARSAALGGADNSPKSAKRQASKAVVVVTSREVVSPPDASALKGSKGIKADVQARTVTFAGHQHTYAEVTTRADNASVARPDLLRSAANNAIHGYNVALLMVDGTGSTCASALLSRTINTIVSNKTERKLYLSVVALKHRTGQKDQVKDMLRVADYTELEVATSPLFGSCINGARFSQIKNTGDIFVTLRDALSVCAVEKSLLVVTLVMRQKDVLYSDVTVNSLMAVIANTDCTPSGEFAGQFLEDTLAETDASKRSLLQTCCGGQPYYTYGVIGVSGMTPDAEATRLLNLGDTISNVMCRFPRPSSTRKLVDYAKKKISNPAADASTPTASGGEFIEEPNWDWDRIREDAEKMLNDEMCKPKAYVLE